MTWIHDNNVAFLANLDADEERSLTLIAALMASREAFEAVHDKQT